jgi:lysine/ornithine N-monooxygenase
MAVIAKHLGIEVAVIGKPFEFWRRHTPPGMLLRSGLEWHIDPLEVHTIQRYFREHGRRRAKGEPLSREEFLLYLQWFTFEKRIEVIPSLIQNLQPVSDGFLATLDCGQMMTSKLVVVAPGFATFPHYPGNLVSMLPPCRFSHSCEAVDFGALKGRHCLVVGGRQSAFEWAALMAEEGAKTVHVVYRHPTPEFTTSDWSWVKRCLDLTNSSPGWFRNLDQRERARLIGRFRTEGRLKLEPWLESRIRRPAISLYPESRVVACLSLGNGKLRIELSGGTVLEVDHVILATGYEMDLGRLEYLRNGSLLGAIEAEKGYPRLDEHFQSSVTGLFFAGFPTMQAFGPFFGFLVGAPVTAKVIGDYVAR